MSEKKFIVQEPKKFEIRSVSYPDSAPISSIDPIEEGGSNKITKEDLEIFVEAPLLEACKILYEKGIETVFSSANKKDISSGYAYLAIDFESLSEKNKKIALELGEIGKMHGSIIKDGVYIKIPINRSSTVGEVKQEAIEIAEKFEQQK
jgi:hypothetical protein